MEKLTSIKTNIFTIVGIAGGALAGVLGGWDTALETLAVLIAADYILGLILAGVFHKSNKSENGALQSLAGWKGICKKGITLIFVLIGSQLDKMLGVDYIRYGIIIAFIVNELISIIETAGLMGAPIPPILMSAIDILKKQNDDTKIEVTK